MPRDKTANHIKLLAAAREEFLEYGYEKASMRSIGCRCGMSAAGLYRHCRDKEDLFDLLVSPCAKRLIDWKSAHAVRYTLPSESGQDILFQDSWIEMMREIVYPHIEEYHLLAARSEGTKYADFLHDLVGDGEQDFRSFLALLRERGYSVRDIRNDELHILHSVYSSALFEPVISNYSKEDALRCLDTVEMFFIPCWHQLIGI